MSDERIQRISPLADQYFPEASEEKKEELTRELRPYFRILLDVYDELDERGLLDRDSPETENLGRI
jgi:hypothetical protein